MEKFKNLLIVSDFDGTLTGSDGKIPEKNIEAIRYFIKNGGRFTVSTGRTMKGFHNYSSELINAPVLLGNGANAYDYGSNKNVFINAIDKDALPIINNISEAFPEIGIEFFAADNSSYVMRPNEQSLHHFSALKIDDYVIIDSLDEKMFPFVKIMLSVNEKTFEVQDYLTSSDLGKLKFIPCTGSYVEILAESAGKGKALHQLSQYLAVPFENIFAVGDGSNDVDMLESAVHSFSPVSGDVLAKNAAKEILCSSDDGVIADVVDFIEHTVRN